MKARLSLIATAVVLAACSKPADPPPAKPAPVAQADVHAEAIAWKKAVSDADVDAAFAQARSENKPLFLYWGAKWCPPCNHLQATLFNRMDFIERSRAFVPVYVDGDSPGAQKLGTRFKVRGYPTMVLFNTEGAELTRLPGEVDASQYTQVLTLGMSAQRPVKAVLADARGGGKTLTPNDWKLLAFYSWETDEQQVVPQDQTPALLKQLAAACPADQAETADRLLLKSVAATDEKDAGKADAATRERVGKVIGDAKAARTHMDVLTNGAADIVKALAPPKTPERAQWVATFDTTLKALQADTTLSRADRLTALIARVDLAKIDRAKDDKSPVVLPEALLADVREQSAKMDREITDGYERQSVITAAGYLLNHAGLGAESDALLKANLAKSHSPYYLMSQLASNAKKRGDKDEALRWYEESFNKAEGPATRLQWGSGYVTALIELAPQDEARIEKATAQLFDEAAAQPNAFYERSARSLERVGSKLVAWNKGNAHAATLKKLQAQLDGVCARLPAEDKPQRDVCQRLLKAGAPKTSA
ncbi:thioredoxin family protein [Piscinibacter sp. XHJ-5]|uniref:thioredoxin family protein n=1 Tax=Piscinibacter sp. XHJ-5 TaxID=3037797 RepID=UPI002452F28C|nr:thioredoxin family protein [Piscinibacter sp. XHJ-5]